MAEKMRREKAKLDNEARKKEEEEEQNKLEGRLRTILQALQENEDTPFEYTLSGMDLGAPRCRLLAANVAFNTTLLTLHLARKEIQDDEGQDLAKMLNTNTTLRKLELEGNCLGPKCAFEFGRALQNNKTLKFLDLESNQLTIEGGDTTGVIEMFKFLHVNTTLLSLNLANNGMNEICGDELNQALAKNDTLIDLDYAMNTFNLEDSREIQDKLKKNKAKYDEERVREWKERKAMRYEDEKLKEMFLQQ